MRQRRIGVWSRVASDTMDLVLLARAYRHKRSDGTRLIAAAGLVGGIMVADLVTAVLLTRAEGRTSAPAVGVPARAPSTTPQTRRAA
jgi:hypothetical protein